MDVNDINRIAEHTAIKGDYSTSSDVRIDGRVDGTVFSRGKVVVGEKAVIVGRLLCRNLDLWGKMDGDVYVQESMQLRSSGSVNGNVSTGKIEVEMDSVLNGAVTMIGDEDFERFVENIVTCPIPEEVVAEPQDSSSL